MCRLRFWGLKYANGKIWYQCNDGLVWSTPCYGVAEATAEFLNAQVDDLMQKVEVVEFYQPE